MKVFPFILRRENSFTGFWGLNYDRKHFSSMWSGYSGEIWLNCLELSYSMEELQNSSSRGPLCYECLKCTFLNPHSYGNRREVYCHKQGFNIPGLEADAPGIKIKPIWNPWWSCIPGTLIRYLFSLDMETNIHVVTFLTRRLVREPRRWCLVWTF